MEEIFYGADKGKWAGKVNQKAVQFKKEAEPFAKVAVKS
jgi:hypothetical protein